MRQILFAILGIVALASSGGVKAAVIPPSNPVAGVSQATLADQWWEWILSTPNSINPLTNDPTGALAGVNNTGPVFFLAGSPGGGFAHRNIAVPAGEPLFFPLYDVADTEFPASIDPNTCLTKPDPYACAVAYLPTSVPTGLVATLDGIALDPNLAQDFPSYFQMSSALVPICLPADSVVGPLPGTTCGAAFVQKGYYMALEGLAPGTYTLVFGGTDASGVTYGAVDILTVVPEPASITLLATGLIGLALARRRKAFVPD